MLLKRSTLWVSLAAILAVAGCGSGGSGSKDSGTNPPVTNPGGGNGGGSNTEVTVSGVAVKGVLKGAKVTAYELDANGQRLANPVGTTETKADGSYELKLTSAYAGGLIEVEVSVIAGTKMVCDASNCGGAAEAEEIDLPSDFVLSAIVEKPSAANTVSASVTAWSTMAANRAKALIADSSKSLAEAARQANAEVSQVVGFDIAKTPSRGLSQLEGATGAQAQYAVMNAAVAEILFSTGDTTGLTSRLNSFTRALEDGVVGDASDSLNLADLSSAVRNVASRVTLDASAVEAINNQTSQYDAAGSDGLKPEYDEDLVVDEGATQEEKIGKFQAFVSQARTWISQVQELDTDKITNAVGVDAEAVETILGSNEDFAFVGLALDEVSSFIVENGASLQDYITDGHQRTLTITDEGTTIGSAKLTFADEGGLTVSVVGSVAGAAAETYKSFNLVLDTTLPVDSVVALAEDEGSLSLSLARLMASTTMTLSGHVGDGVNNPLTLNKLRVNLELDKAVESLETEVINSNFKSAEFAGDVSIARDGVSFKGSVDLKAVKLVSGFNVEGLGSSPLSIKHFRIAGEFTPAEGHSFAASAAMDLQNASTFDVFAWSDYSGRNDQLWAPVDRSVIQSFVSFDLDETENWGLLVGIQPGRSSFISSHNYTGGSYESEATAQQIEIAVNQARAALANEFAGNTQLANAIDIERIKIDAGSDWGYNYSDLVVWYQLPDLETATNFAKAAFSASVKVNIPELQAAQVTATVNRTALKGGSALANVKWNGGDYSIAVSSPDVDAAGVINLRFFNSQGYELNIQAQVDAHRDLTDMTGKALLNGEQVGEVEYRRGFPVIVYPNGNEEIFESLF